MNTQGTGLSDLSGLDKRLDQIGWGIFLTMIGTIWLVPDQWVPRGTWALGTGVLLLVLNAIRYRSGLAWCGFTTALGVVLLAAGLGSLMGFELPLVAICLIAIGVTMIISPLVARRA